MLSFQLVDILKRLTQRVIDRTEDTREKIARFFLGNSTRSETKVFEKLLLPISRKLDGVADGDKKVTIRSRFGSLLVGPQTLRLSLGPATDARAALETSPTFSTRG